MPGSSPTMERRSPTSRLKSVDFPTFGRPTIATSGNAPSRLASLFCSLDILKYARLPSSKMEELTRRHPRNV
jgi:hypothetical protein